MACLLEVAAPKPGNVHRGADFEDTTLEDFMRSAVVLGQSIDQMPDQPVGTIIKTAVESTIETVGSNTNLGMILLIVPIAKAMLQAGKVDRDSVHDVLDSLNLNDAELIFEAIRIANPGGLGTAEKGDVLTNEPTLQTIGVVDAMRLAADRDLVAKQYVNGFSEVLKTGTALLQKGEKLFSKQPESIVFAHVKMMSMFPDSLIARKCGVEIASHSQMLACKAIEKIEGQSNRIVDKDMLESYWSSISELDFWLRSDDNKRNPGTTADLIAASLFVEQLKTQS